MPTLTKIGRNTIHDSAVSTAQLEDGQVLLADIGSNAVGNDELLNSDSFEMNGLTANGTSALKGQVTMGSGATDFDFPTTRGSANQVLKLNASGLLGWSAISVSGYDGVAWDYDVRSGSDPQTIPLYKGIVVPGPMVITDGTVIVNGRLHVI